MYSRILSIYLVVTCFCFTVTAQETKDTSSQASATPTTSEKPAKVTPEVNVANQSPIKPTEAASESTAKAEEGELVKLLWFLLVLTTIFLIAIVVLLIILILKESGTRQNFRNDLNQALENRPTRDDLTQALKHIDDALAVQAKFQAVDDALADINHSLKSALGIRSGHQSQKEPGNQPADS
jgi:hypothetical protein